MTYLSHFSGEESELLISLPYKVGVWMSYADDEDGEHDDEREVAALEQCIQAIAELYEDQPFVKEVTAQTLRLRSEWPRWAAQAFHVPAEAQRAVSMLDSKATEEVRKNYASALIEIATTVAQAYGEFGAFDDEDEGPSGFGALVGKIVSGFSGMSKDDDNHPMNISAAEDSALCELAQILRAE